MRPKILDTFIEADKPQDWRFQDLTGRAFGRLTVVNFAGARANESMSLAKWNCICACGNKVAVRGQSLRTGDTQSCGCLHSERTKNGTTTHGESRNSPEYHSYIGAKGRCTNPSNHAFNDYGGRGIEFRFDSYEHFLAVVGRRPTPRHTLDRIDNAGHYEPRNVHWATKLQQARNTRRNRMITLHGETRPQSEWAVIYGISPKSIHKRRQHGWCDECAITLPLGDLGKHHVTGCPHRN